MGTKPDLKSMNWMGDNKMLRWMLAVTAANKCHRLRLCLGDAKEVFEVMLMAQSQPTKALSHSRRGAKPRRSQGAPNLQGPSKANRTAAVGWSELVGQLIEPSA